MRPVSPRWMVIGLLLLLWAAWSLAADAHTGRLPLAVPDSRDSGLVARQGRLPAAAEPPLAAAATHGGSPTRPAGDG